MKQKVCGFDEEIDRRVRDVIDAESFDATFLVGGQEEWYVKSSTQYSHSDIN